MRRAIAAVLLLASGLSAQGGEPSPIEIRLLEMLHQNRVISDAQHEELLQVAADMRRDEERRTAERKDLATEVDAAAAAVEERATRLEHRAGRGFRFEAGERFRLDVSGRLQVRFTDLFWQDNEDTNGENEPDFSVEQARLTFDGYAFGEEFRFKLQVDFAGDTAETEVDFLNIVDTFESSNRVSELKDGYFEYAPWKAFRVRAGQFKVPYSRQALTSAGELQFVDRAVTHRVFAPARDVGVMVHGSAFGAKDELLAYAAGVFDGEGENRSNDDEGLLWAGRVMVSPFGAVPYSESSLERKSDFDASLGLNAWLHQDDDHLGEGDDVSYGADLALRWQGLAFDAEIHYMESDRFPGDDVRAWGWFAQLGWMVIDERFEVALRTAQVDWTNNGDANAAAREHLFVLSHYWSGHDLKLQADFGWIEDHEGDHDDNRDGWRARVQMQIVF